MEIRKAELRDRKDIQEIASLTWEGHDYLPEVFDSWIRQGNFYVLEKDGKIIGTVKMTILPERVGWLEGLRVHPDYRGKGFGRELNDFILNRARNLKKKNKISDIEYSTYYKNIESLSLGRQSGFRIVCKFYLLYRENQGKKKEPEEDILNFTDLNNFEEYISEGFRFLRKTENSFKFLKSKCKSYSSGRFKFYSAGHEDFFVLLSFSKSAINEYIKALNFISGDESYDVIIPNTGKVKIDSFREYGFSFWDGPEEPNIYILRNFD